MDLKHKRVFLIIGAVAIVTSMIIFIILAAYYGTLGPKSSESEVGSNGKCPKRKNPPLLIVSFDGFRAEYLTRGITPTIENMRQAGVYTAALRPSFPTITFPNHYTIATGLFPESHGIVDNMFFDYKLNRSFSYKASDRNDSVWWGGEPIWVTAKKNGKRVYTYFWVGDMALIKGYRPDVWVPFNKSHSFQHRVDTVVDWLSSEEGTGPDLVMLYFEEPDMAGHYHGTRSNYTEKMIKHVDSMLDRLMTGLRTNGLLDCINLVVLSDHGMQNIDWNKTISLTPLFRNSSATAEVSDNDYNAEGLGEVPRISLTSKSNTTIDALFNALQCRENSTKLGYQVYKKQDFPRRLHYANSDRLESILMTLNEGLQAYKDASIVPHWGIASHGYDNHLPSMQAIFVAQGPSFKSGMETQSFQNVELYNLFCELLGVEPAPNNGTRGTLSHLLKEPKIIEDQPGTKMTTFEVKISAPVSEECLDKIRSCLGDRERVLDPAIQSVLLETIKNESVPHGPPEVTSSAPFTDLQMLVTPDGIVGYSSQLTVPVWTSYEAGSRSSGYFSHPSKTCPVEGGECNLTPTYDDKEIVMVPLMQTARLYGPGMPLLAANTLPMYRLFHSEVWTKLFDLLIPLRWDFKWKHTYVQFGPIFDSEPPYGIADPLLEGNLTKPVVPSHFYVIVTRSGLYACFRRKCGMEVTAFILPHSRTGRTKCQEFEAFLMTHSARVRDVELATGLKFYSDLPAEERIRLITQLPTKTWD